MTAEKPLQKNKPLPSEAAGKSKSLYYWNRDNFEGLKSVGEKYSAVEGYELFGKYCLLKEQGLKKPAVDAINAFVADVKTRPLPQQRAIAAELSALGFYNGGIHQLLAHPLVVLMQGVLESWVAYEPKNSIPHKWLGYVAGDLLSYERALALDPKDEICINRIAQACLNSVDYQTHHLSESLFLGELADAKSALSKAQSLIAELSSENLKFAMQNEVDYYQRLLACWQEYSSLGIAEQFPIWCASKGQEFNFWSIVYYEQ